MPWMVLHVRQIDRGNVRGLADIEWDGIRHNGIKIVVHPSSGELAMVPTEVPCAEDKIWRRHMMIKDERKRREWRDIREGIAKCFRWLVEMEGELSKEETKSGMDLARTL